MGIVDIAYILSVKVSSLQLSVASYIISSEKSSMDIFLNPAKSSRRIAASASSSGSESFTFFSKELLNHFSSSTNAG